MASLFTCISASVTVSSILISSVLFLSGIRPIPKAMENSTTAGTVPDDSA